MSSRGVSVADVLVRAASLVVPRRRRVEWLAEWRSEFLHAQDDALARGETRVHADVRLTLRALAAWPDAVAVRRTSGGTDNLPWHARQATRMLRREPGFAVRVIFTLALGMGAATAIFSVVDGLLLQPPPFRAADRLVLVHNAETGSMLPEEIAFWKTERTVFETLHGFTVGIRVLTGIAEPRNVSTALIEPGVLERLGVVPALGRTFRDDEAEPGSGGVVVLTHAFWRDVFGGDSTVIGRPITLDGVDQTVIGILPAHVRRLPTGPADVVLPLESAYGARLTGLLAWLRPGLSGETAQARLDAIAERQDRQQAREPGWQVFLLPIDDLPGNTSERALVVLACAVLLLLLIACVNAAGLLFVRGLVRTPELAIRTALGAARATLFAHVLLEALVLALIAGAAGVVIAWWGLHVLLALVPGELLADSYASVGIDGRVLLFSVVLTVLTGLLFGAGPALRAMRTSVVHAGRRSTATRAELRARRVVQVVQLGLAMLLLSGAALFARSYLRMLDVPFGFEPAGLLMLQLEPTRLRPDTAARAAFQHALDERLRNLPGVREVSWTTGAIPPSPRYQFISSHEGIELDDGTRRPPGDTRFLPWGTVDVNYLRTLQVNLTAGRAFTDEDVGSGENPVIIGAALAALLFPGQDPIGRRFRVSETRPWTTIVGVAGTLRLESPGNRFGGQYAMLLPGRLGAFVSMHIAIRTDTDPAALAPAVRAAVHEIDPDQPISALMPVTDALAASLAEPRFILVLTVTFALIALVLAIMGVYALIAFMVAQRTREIGVRVALGAHGGAVARRVLASGLGLASVGIAIGLGLALVTARFIESLLFGITAFDSVALGMTALLLICSSALALIGPARRAARIDPMTALRSE